MSVSFEANTKFIFVKTPVLQCLNFVKNKNVFV